jgi:hypothetical protein
MSREVLISPGANYVEWAKAMTENREGDWWQRVVKYKLVFDPLGQPTFKVDRSTPLLDAEYTGMMGMRDLAMLGQDWIIWFSPAGGKSEYPESRIIVGKVEKKIGGVEIDCLGICSPQNQEDCLFMAKRFKENGGTSLGTIFEAEDLREKAIGFEGKDNQILQLIKKVVNVPGVWAAVEDGRVENNNRVMEKRVAAIVADLPHLRELSGWMIQRYIETEMARNFGVRLQGGGNHGGSVLGGGGGVFDQVFGMTKMVGELDSRLVECENCHKVYMKKKGECPACKS